MTAPDGAAGRLHRVPDHFDPDDVEDAGNPYPRPLLLASLPPLGLRRAGDRSATLAYGGEDARVYLLRGEGEGEGEGEGDDAAADAAAATVVRQFSDEVRALAASPDGRRVAVGFDDGSTRIFAYDDDGDDDALVGRRHPFLLPAATGAAYPSQTQDDDDDDDDDGNAPTEFEGPRLEAAIRQLAFDPRAGEGGRYHLAVASESGVRPLVVVDAADMATIAATHLGEKSSEEHECGGVRSVAYSADVGGGTGGGVLLTTLGMDGRAVTWDVSAADDPGLLWDVCVKDNAAAVPKPDGGEPTADAGDKACRPVWDVVAAAEGATEGVAGSEDLGVLYLPGQNSVQYRLCPLAAKGADGKRATPTTAEIAARLRGPPTFVHDEERGHRDTIVALAVPPPGSHQRRQQLVTGGRDGRVLLWDLNLRAGTGEAHEVPLKRSAPSRGLPTITSISWQQEGEMTVAWADGVAVTVPVPEELEKEDRKKATAATEDQELEEEEGLATQPPEAKAKKVMFKEDGENEEWQSDEDGAGLAGDASASSGKETKEREMAKEEEKKDEDVARFVNDEAEDADVQYDDVVEPSAKPADAQVGEDGGHGVDDDVSFSNPDDPPDSQAVAAAAAAPVAAKPYRQPAFVPSSTPVSDARRLLCWNHIGVATLRPLEVDDPGQGLNLVDVVFTDSGPGGRRPFTFTDNFGFSVGALGEEGGLFAADPVEDDEDDEDDRAEVEAMDQTTRNIYLREKARQRRARKSGAFQGSQVYFNRFETFGRSQDKDWVMALPGGEKAVGCAVGRGWGAVVTSARFLRLFTAGGVQGPVHWLPGDPVTVVGRDRFVATFYHAAGGPCDDGTQSLGYSVRDGLTGATLTEGCVSALSAGSELTWVGFTDKCALAVMDSAGYVSLLARYSAGSAAGRGGNWMPVLDTLGMRRTKDDRHWPVEVHGGKLVCVPLRGGKEYPDAARRPVTTTVPLRVPMASGRSLKTDPLEEGSLRAAFALDQDKILDDYLVFNGEANAEDVEEEYVQKCTQVDRVTLKLFASFVKLGKVERGFDLAQRLHNEKSFDIAINMADRAGHRTLADRIEEVKEQRYPPFDGESENEGSDGADSYRSDSFDEQEPVVTTRQEQMEMLMRREISPEGGGGLSTPQQPRRSHNDAEESEQEGYNSTDGESPPREALKRKFEEDHQRAVAASRKRVNPFAKKKLESPARGIMKVLGSPAKMTLSRSSTFSAKSRQKQRKGKQIV